MGILERFKRIRERVAERIEISKLERQADRQSERTAISEARQLKREAKAKYIKEKYGTYKPFSDKIKEAAKSMKERREQRESVQRFHPKKAKKGKTVSHRPDILGAGNINMDFGGPFGKDSLIKKDLITGKDRD